MTDEQPPAGTRADCQMCGQEIEFVGPYWQHTGELQPRHPALPITKTDCAECDRLRKLNAELIAALGGFLWVGNNIEAMDFDRVQFRKYFEAAIADGRIVYNKAKND